MAMTITPDHDTEFETSGRRRKITKFALAGVAVLGVGAALTSAAWTDNVWFGGSASSGTVDLVGSTDNSNWFEGEEGNVDLVISDFVLAPDTTVTKRVWVRNDGNLPVAVTLNSEAVGALFDPSGLGATLTEVLNDADGVIAPNQKVSIDVSISAPAWVDGVGQGQLSENNTIVLQVAATSDLP